MKVIDSQIQNWNDLRAGKEKGLHSLYLLYYQDLLRYGLNLTSDAELSKEYINLLFLSLWKQREKLPEVRSPKAYIITSYKNKILFTKKKAGNLTIIYSERPGQYSTPVTSCEETLIELQEYERLQQKIKSILRSLSGRQQEIIELRFMEEMSYDDIATHLGISVRTVYNSIHESLKLLRNQVNKKDFRMLCFFIC